MNCVTSRFANNVLSAFPNPMDIPGMQALEPQERTMVNDLLRTAAAGVDPPAQRKTKAVKDKVAPLVEEHPAVQAASAIKKRKNAADAPADKEETKGKSKKSKLAKKKKKTDSDDEDD